MKKKSNDIISLEVQAESDVINASWNEGGTSNGLADTIGLMVYEGDQALLYVKNYAAGSSQWEGFPIRVSYLFSSDRSKSANANVCLSVCLSVLCITNFQLRCQVACLD